MEKSYVYRDDDLKYSEHWAPEITKTARILDVDPEMIAGHLQKEINDRTNRREKDWRGAVGVWAQSMMEEAVANTKLFDSPDGLYGHETLSKAIKEKYTDKEEDHMRSLRNTQERQKYKYWDNVAFSEWGPASIKIGTAMGQIKRYAKRFEADPDATDPLELRQYIDNPSLLTKDLADWSRPTSIRITGLLAEDFKNEVRNADQYHWKSLTPEQKNATFVTWAVLGKKNSNEEREKTQKIGEQVGEDIKWQPAPGTTEDTGAPGFLRNVEKIREALERGGAHRVIWPDVR